MKKHYRNIAIYSVLFLLILILVKTDLIGSFDKSLQSQTYNTPANEGLKTAFLLITNYTIGTVMAVAAVALLLAFKKHFYGIISLGIAFTGLYIVVEAMKRFIERSRPFIIDPVLPYLGHEIPDGFSFPSGHTTISFFLCIVVVYKFHEYKWVKYVAYTLAGLVGFSRVYLGAHYPLDVFGGALLGLIFGHVAIIIDKLLPRYISLPKFLPQN